MTNLRLPPFRAFQSHLLPPGKPGPPDGSWVGFQSILYKSGNLGDQKENRAGWPGFSASSRDAVTSKRGADWRRCARRFRSGFCIASRQEKSEEERGNSTFPGARPGPNHNLMFVSPRICKLLKLNATTVGLALVGILEPS